MSALKFAESLPSYNAAEVFLVRIDPQISSSYQLLRALYYLLWFPGYFGFNWDALSDCLRDLSWIPCRKVVLVHQVLPGLPREELRAYLEVLNGAVLDWSDGDAHDIEVIFPASDRVVVEMLLMD
jgi:hypothetical protein